MFEKLPTFLNLVTKKFNSANRTYKDGRLIQVLVE